MEEELDRKITPPPHTHKYIKNSSSCGTISIEHILNTGREDSRLPKKQASLYQNEVGQKINIKKKQRTLGWGSVPWEGVV